MNTLDKSLCTKSSQGRKLPVRDGSGKRRASLSVSTAWGFEWPRDLAYIINGQRVTFSEIRAARIERQQNHLADILRCTGPVRQAAHLWVFFVPGMIYGGWHLYLRTHKHAWWLKRPEGIALEIMATYPCGVLPIAENFHEWKTAFYAAYGGTTSGRQQAMIAGWVECVRDGAIPQRFIAK